MSLEEKAQTDTELVMATTDSNNRRPSLPLQGRTAIVTGASGGIGRAVALRLASLGASLVLGDISSTQTELLASEINSSCNKLRAFAVRVDVSDPPSVECLFDTAESAFSPDKAAHILVSCAGVADPEAPALADASVEHWDRTFHVNARGTFLCCQEAAKRLVRGGGGRIVTVSTSLVGLSLPRFGAYTASKAAVEAMTRVMSKELKGSGVTANCVAPGPTATELLFTSFVDEEGGRVLAESCPMGRLGLPKDIAAVVGFLATDDAEWVNGQVIRVNGGDV